MNRDPSGNEATRDPIFLCQVRRYHLHELPEWCESDGDGGFDVPDPVALEVKRLSFVGFDRDDDALSVTDRSALFAHLTTLEASSGIGYMAAEYWDTVSVQLTRGEAEAWCRATSHRYEHGWRVYCIPCDGSLATVLNWIGSGERESRVELAEAITEKFLNATHAEYQYWSSLDSEGVMLQSIGAMGACSNLIAVVAGVLSGKSCDEGFVDPPLTVEHLKAAGWDYGESSVYWYHPAYSEDDGGWRPLAIVWTGGIHLKIGDFSVVQTATLGDLVRLESLLARTRTTSDGGDAPDG